MSGGRRGRVTEEKGLYYDSRTGSQISAREAHERKAGLHSDLEEAYIKNRDLKNAQKHRDLAKRYKEHSRDLSNDPNDRAAACYITTACVKAEGLPDDCPELQTLRFFRDNHLANQPRGGDLIQEYYSTAPLIVQAINTKPEAHEILCRIFDGDITTAVSMIQRGDNEGALKHYMQMTDRLKGEFLK